MLYFYELKERLQNLMTAEGGYYDNHHITIQMYSPYDQTPQKVLVSDHDKPLARLSFYDTGEIIVYLENKAEPEQIDFSAPQKFSEEDPLPAVLKHAVNDFFRDFRFPTEE